MNRIRILKSYRADCGDGCIRRYRAASLVPESQSQWLPRELWEYEDDALNPQPELYGATDDLDEEEADHG